MSGATAISEVGGEWLIARSYCVGFEHDTQGSASFSSTKKASVRIESEVMALKVRSEVDARG
jgi:hypothetical protein